MSELTSPSGSVALAISAVLLVLGYRLARPGRAREWIALAAYAVALAAQVLGARGLLAGPAFTAGFALRIAGAALLVAGLLVAGVPARAMRRAGIEGRAQSTTRRSFDLVYAGLGLVLLGQLARAPSLAGAIATIAAVVVCAFVALTPRS